MKIEQPTKFIASHLQHRLHPAITVERIQSALPGIEEDGDSWDGKSDHAWHFMADGKECGIWSYKGLRWSAYGPLAVFQALGLEVIGGPMDAVKASQLARQEAGQ